jgi:Family of unknown function (DUF6982)
MNNVVARFVDGRVLKGTSLNVDPNKPAFHVRTLDGPVEVKLADLKALFFVKSLDGNAAHDEAMAPTDGDPRLVGGKPVAVIFKDREKIVGVTNRFPPNKPFFFMLPIDPRSNNIRILVNKGAAISIREATDLAAS